MKALLTPAIIEEAYGKYLTLADAQCLLYLFTVQATHSQWLDSNTVACWLFKTNRPTEFQLNRAKSILHKLSSCGNGCRDKACLLDMKIQPQDSGYGSIILQPVYKLSPSAIDVNSATACFA